MNYREWDKQRRDAWRAKWDNEPWLNETQEIIDRIVDNLDWQLFEWTEFDRQFLRDFRISP